MGVAQTYVTVPACFLRYSLLTVLECRESKDERYDQDAFKRKAANAFKKQRILSSLYRKRQEAEESSDLVKEEGAEEPKKKRRRKKGKGVF